MRATLGEVLTDEAYERMIPLADRWADGVQAVIDEFALPWVVKRLGCRAEYWPRPVPPRNGGEAAAAEDEELDRFLHLFMLNRGVLMTPFHNMALMSPQTTAADVDRHTRLLSEAAGALVGITRQLGVGGRDEPPELGAHVVGERLGGVRPQDLTRLLFSVLECALLAGREPGVVRRPVPHPRSPELADAPGCVSRPGRCGSARPDGSRPAPVSRR